MLEFIFWSFALLCFVRFSFSPLQFLFFFPPFSFKNKFKGMLVNFVLHAFIGFLHTCLLAYLHVCASNKNKQTNNNKMFVPLFVYLFFPRPLYVAYLQRSDRKPSCDVWRGKRPNLRGTREEPRGDGEQVGEAMTHTLTELHVWLIIQWSISPCEN